MTITPFQNRCYIAGFADQSLRFRQTKKLKYKQYCRFFIKAPNTHNRSLRFYWIHFTSTFQIHATIFATVCYKTKLLLIYALYLFVCFGFIVPLENFSLIWRRHHDQWRAANFLTNARHSWPFSLLWHKASVYNGHLWGPVTLTPLAERLAVELLLPGFTT